MKLKISFDLNSEDLPMLQDKLRLLIDQLTEFESDELRKIKEELCEDNPFMCGYYNDFSFDFDLF